MFRITGLFSTINADGGVRTVYVKEGVIETDNDAYISGTIIELHPLGACMVYKNSFDRKCVTLFKNVTPELSMFYYSNQDMGIDIEDAMSLVELSG